MESEKKTNEVTAVEGKPSPETRPTSELRDLRPEKDPMGASGKAEESNPRVSAGKPAEA